MQLRRAMQRQNRANGITPLSKFLSLVLRHKPEAIGVQLDGSGWADISDIVEKSRKAGVNLTTDLICNIVAASAKQRFAISEDGLKIRANQGHSLPVDLGLKTTKPPETLYHGTAGRNISSILHQGICKGNRQHVHLSLDSEGALKVGRRHGSPAVVVIAAVRMHEDGFNFFESDNGVWLTDHVPKEYIAMTTKKES